MKKNSLIIKIALGLLTLGLILTALGVLIGGKFTILKDEIGYRVYDNDNRITDSSSLDDFENIDIDIELDKVEIIKSTENKLELDYSEKVGAIQYKIENNTLTIKQSNNTTIGIDMNLGNNKAIDTLKIYTKEDITLKNVVITQDYGSLTINGVDLDVANINSSYGDVNLSGFTSDKITVMMEDGNLATDNLSVHNTFKLQNKYGNVDLDNCDFDTLIAYLEDGNLDISKVNSNYAEFKNKYGNIYATDFTTNGLLSNADDGDMEFRGDFLGDSSINNKYGNISVVSNQDESTFNYSIINKYGNLNIDNQIYEGSLTKNNNASNNLDIVCEDGNIKVDFTK